MEFDHEPHEQIVGDRKATWRVSEFGTLSYALYKRVRGVYSISYMDFEQVKSVYTRDVKSGIELIKKFLGGEDGRQE